MSLGFESDVPSWSLVWCPYLQRCCPMWNLCCMHGNPHTPQEAGHFLHPLQPGPQRHPGPSNAGVPTSCGLHGATVSEGTGTLPPRPGHLPESTCALQHLRQDSNLHSLHSFSSSQHPQVLHCERSGSSSSSPLLAAAFIEFPAPGGPFQLHQPQSRHLLQTHLLWQKLHSYRTSCGSKGI